MASSDEPPIQRLLHITPANSPVHIYTIPPLTSTRGFSASSWTAPPRPTAQQIFTARIRILETSHTNSDHISTSILLEDPSTGDLFAAAPYTFPAVVQQANDSSRFFAIRVQGEGGMKATLGLGFEERGAALDFNIALSEARKVLGFDQAAGGGQGKGKVTDGVAEEKRDFSLKEGEKIHIQVGGKGRREQKSEGVGEKDDSQALFSIAPPPGAAGKAENSFPSIAPPPPVVDQKKTAQELGFDDGEFGEFQ